MPQDFTDYYSTLVQVMAWCHQAPSHYLNQCWQRPMTSYGITRPQWVNQSLRLSGSQGKAQYTAWGTKIFCYHISRAYIRALSRHFFWWWRMSIFQGLKAIFPYEYITNFPILEGPSSPLAKFHISYSGALGTKLHNHNHHHNHHNHHHNHHNHHHHHHQCRNCSG